jgi:hypothetical protein
MKRKNSFCSLLFVITLLCNAQVPQKFNYQAVVRDAQQGLITGRDVGFRMSILEGSASGEPVYVETHTVTTNAYGIADLVIGEGSVSSGVFGDILWGEDSYFLKVEVDPAGGSAYEHIGTSQLISVPYALYSGNVSSPTRKFTVQEEEGHPVDSALFEVRNAEGQTVFAVYPEGTRVYILDEESKGKKGGFAVGGYSRSSKGITQEYMRVTPDSIRLYVDEEATKGKKGGFAVGGYSRSSKRPTDNYFMLKPDSAKFLMVSETPDETGSNALTVTTKSKSGGNDYASLFHLSRENYFIGHRAGSSNTTGDQNCFIGYESGLKNSSGFGNVFLGQRAGWDNSEGDNNVFIGVDAGQANTTGDLNTSVGFQAGYGTTTGNYNSIFGFWAGYENQGGDLNTYFGAHAGHQVRNGNSNTYVGAYTGSEKQTGIQNTFIGMRAGSEVGSNFNTILGAYAGSNFENGGSNVFIGARCGSEATGRDNTFIGANNGWFSNGDNNTFIGHSAGNMCVEGANNVFIGMASGQNNNGSGNVFIGQLAGFDAQGSDMLIIDNEASDSTRSLIWGKFDQEIIRMNSRVGIGMNAGDSVALAVAGEAYKDGNSDWTTTSDARVKTDIHNIEGGLEKIMQLRPVTFRYTDQWREANPGVKDQHYYNYIAQEFAEVFPESVYRGPESLDGDPVKLLRMNSQPAQVVAIRAIQELAEQVRIQQTKLEQLQEENLVLRQMYQDIQNQMETH